MGKFELIDLMRENEEDGGEYERLSIIFLGVNGT